MRKSGLFTAGSLVLALLASNAASARDVSMMQYMRGQRGVQVSASFQTTIPIAGQSSLEEEAKSTESARKALYQIAAKECAVITQVFKGSCRMTNINVRSYTQDRGNGLRQILVNASANYVVMPDGEENTPDDKKL